jgi:hypothetical protein
MSKLVMHPGVYPKADDLGDRLRGIDKLEVRATSGLDPAAGIEHSIHESSRWWVGTVNGQEEMVVGVAPMQGVSGWGRPWMLSTDRVFKTPGVSRDFLRRTPEFLSACSEGYDVLYNLICEHNYDSRRWLRFAGFLIRETPTHVFGGYRFLEFIYVTPGGHYDMDKILCAHP